MSQNEHYRHILAEAAKRFDIFNVEPDPEGTCTLALEGTFINISCTPGSNLIMIALPVAEITGKCPRAILERLLNAQLFFKETRGGTFSYNRETGLVLLHLNLLADTIDGVMLGNALQNMYDVARTFRIEIAEMMSAEKNTSIMNNEPAFSLNDIAI